jgi:general secretion pathway protein J
MTRTADLSRGFSLIEVLVALAVMSLVATVLIASLELGGRTWQRVTRAATDMEDISRGQEFLRQRLSSIQPYDETDGAVSSPEVLVGTEDTLEFSGFAPHTIDGRMLRYQIALSTSEPGTLEVRYRPDQHSAVEPVSSTWSHERLLAHVTALSILFLEQTPDTAAHWVDRWRDPKRFPQLIRIDISFAPTDTRRWPPLYIEPRVDTNTSCIFDVVARRCRSGA